MTDLSIIVVSFNTKKLLEECLNSVFDDAHATSLEVWVVDNASTDGSVEMVTRRFPQVKIIKNDQNWGFAKANNQAITKTSGRYILLLNSDTEVLDGAIDKMILWMDAHLQVGISTCQLLNSDQSIQASGGFFPTIPRLICWMLFLDDLPVIGKLIKPFHPHSPDFIFADDLYNKEHFQDWVTGAFFMVRRDVVDKIGILDDNFFMYVEEMEYCYRAKQAGFEIAYVPFAQILHHGGGSSGFSSRNAIVGEYKGLVYFYKKHFSFYTTAISVIFLKLGAILRWLIWGVALGRKEAKEAYGQIIFG
ncbi:glycosyltransferase family 2 protein [Candidatus Daviesbacteria bacterium]|nr:glycosyltransferase family 2 protein [Candidatus Daviesbacteria bacterium]